MQSLPVIRHIIRYSLGPACLLAHVNFRHAVSDLSFLLRDILYDSLVLMPPDSGLHVERDCPNKGC